MARSLNRVQLIGNLTRDPELRYTPAGTAVCSFGIATNRNWTTETGEKKEEVEFHNIVAWNKLADICSQFLTKGRKVYVEGRLATRSWTAQDGTPRNRTEVVIDDMILLDAKRPTSDQDVEPARREAPAEKTKKIDASQGEEVEKGEKKMERVAQAKEEVAPEDIPF